MDVGRRDIFCQSISVSFVLLCLLHFVFISIYSWQVFTPYLVCQIRNTLCNGRNLNEQFSMLNSTNTTDITRPQEISDVMMAQSVRPSEKHVLGLFAQLTANELRSVLNTCNWQPDTNSCTRWDVFCATI